MRNLDQRFMNNPLDPKYYETYDRVFGWICFYCKREGKHFKNFEDVCKECGRKKEEAQLNS